MKTNLAAQANKNSIQNVHAKNKDAWLSLFDKDALLRDPVGKSPLDPEGLGKKGIDEIASFWDEIIAPANLSIDIEKRYPSGEHGCAVAMIAKNTLAPGVETVIDMLGVYEVNDAGKIVNLSVFWSWQDMEEQLKALG